MGKIIAQSMWYGRSLSLVEELSIKSFLANGFEFHLYTYSELNVPNGTLIRDANEVIPEDEIFQNTLGAKSYSMFSNRFRYALLEQRAGWWFDLDIICLKPFSYETPYVFGFERQDYINNAVLFVDKANSILFSKLANRTEGVKKQKVWGETGPTLLTQQVYINGLEKFTEPIERFYPISYYQLDLLNKDISLGEESLTLHLWNELLTRNSFDRNNLYPRSSLLGSLQYKYL